MGFLLDQFFKDLYEVLHSDMGKAKKLKRLYQLVEDAHAYAKECGQLHDA